ncbi:MAG: AMP-binding protein [Prolixibacteraceae bacterium]|jgi:fatty-acyl-CoA synthase|nr:AMP-binding protein [Prolixibacteraceae bacterium]NLX28247.1 AMP-binding protein [Bacteroidales bacterium]HNQ37940.1 AMP-binding protein [Prolixibacteraceae bacterium]HOY50568.1 AMP-binding protein [Prolixibacteraceae bacterium]HPJ77537.1 AMP-binding protein [Prolixibacteraceae bacterium]
MQLIDYTLGEILEKWALETPDQEFIVYPDRNLRFTYAGFNDRVDRLAKGLLYIGLQPGDKVGIWAKNVPDWLTFMFATAKIGAILVTINTSYKKAELEYILHNADIHTLCMVDGYKESDYLQMIFDLVPELREQPRGELRSPRFPELRNVVFIGQQKHRGMYNTQELLLMGSHVDDFEVETIRGSLSCHDVVNMQYTSGTTGFPKGVMLSHHNILNNGFSVGECMKFTSAERVMTPVPLFHCFGCVLSLCAVITHGATMVLVEEFDPLMVLASVQREKCTALYGVPTMFIAELHHPMFDMFDLSSLRTGIMAGSLCPIETMNQVMTKMHAKDIIIVYGLTETSPGMTATRTHNPPEVRATTVGFELPNVEVKIVHPETGRECAAGEQGEICCRGYNVMKGYYKNDEATRKAIDADGFLHSGDLAVKTEEGFYRITGRIKDMIIRGGENIYPREIENYLYKMEQIEAVEVAAVPSPKYGEQVGAFIRVKKGFTLTEEEVTDFCRGQIARYKVPKYIFFVSEFPMTASGKIQKYKLTQMSTRLLEEAGKEII